VLILDKQFIKFAAVGVVGTAVHYTALVALVEGFNLSALIATGIGFVLGAITNYILNYHYTFKSNKRHGEALTKFLIVAFIGGVINQGMMWLGVTVLSANYLLSQIAATTIVLFWNFIINRAWSFKESVQIVRPLNDNE